MATKHRSCEFDWFWEGAKLCTTLLPDPVDPFSICRIAPCADHADCQMTKTMMDPQAMVASADLTMQVASLSSLITIGGTWKFLPTWFIYFTWKMNENKSCWHGWWEFWLATVAGVTCYIPTVGEEPDGYRLFRARLGIGGRCWFFVTLAPSRGGRINIVRINYPPWSDPNMSSSWGPICQGHHLSLMHQFS